MACIWSNERSAETEGDHVRLATGQQEAIWGVRQALRETAFDNSKLLPPRRLDEIAREEVAAFLSHAEASDGEVARQRGRALASQGLGHRSILVMTEALRIAGCDGLGRAEKAVSDYVVALLQGYMIGREQDLLQEQNRTLEALLRARSRTDG